MSNWWDEDEGVQTNPGKKQGQWWDADEIADPQVTDLSQQLNEIQQQGPSLQELQAQAGRAPTEAGEARLLQFQLPDGIPSDDPLMGEARHFMHTDLGSDQERILRDIPVQDRQLFLQALSQARRQYVQETGTEPDSRFLVRLSDHLRSGTFGAARSVERFGREFMGLGSRDEAAFGQFAADATQMHKDPLHTRALEREGVVGKTVQTAEEGFLGAAQMTPDVIASLGASAASGPGGAVAYWWSRLAPDMEADIRNSGVDPDIAKKTAAMGALPIAAVEMLQISQLTPQLKQGARQASTIAIREWLKTRAKKAGATFIAEMSEEALQEILEVGTKAAAHHLDENAPGINWSEELDNSLAELTQAAKAMPFLMGPGQVIESVSQLQDLQEMRAKGFITEEDARKANLTPEESKNRSSRKAAIDQRIADLESLQLPEPEIREEVQEQEVQPSVDVLPPTQGTEQSTVQAASIPLEEQAVTDQASDVAQPNYSSLTTRELSQLLRDRQIPGRGKATKKADRIALLEQNDRETAQTGVTSAASKPSDRPDITPQPGSSSGAMLQPVQTPELFQLAKDLFSGTTPSIKKLGGAAGQFKGMENIGPLSILIDPTTAADEQALGQTLAHEIGHLIDFLPENTLKRGNLLGRLKSLRNFMKSTMPELDKPDLARIRREARKEAGKDASKESVDTIQQRILEEQGFLANSVVRDELLELTKWWSGDYTGAKDSYVKYRESSRELYAEAVSVFLNSPGDLESRAPNFYQAMLENLDAKPEVLEAYSTLQQMLNGTGQELAESRTQTVRDMFGSAEEHINYLRKSQEHRRKSVWSGISDFLGQYFLTSAQPVFTKLGRKPFKRGESEEAEAARFALDELFTMDSPNHTFLRNIDQQVYQPLIEIMEQRGLDRTQAESEADFTLGEYLFHWRVANERDTVANPAGFTATPSAAQLDAIRQRIGDNAYAQLEEQAQIFHDLVFEVSERATEEGVYSRQNFDEVIAPNRDNYAAFRVTHHIDNPDIIATGVIKQIGTFSDIQNPFHATMLKVVRLNRLVELNKAKNRVRVFLESEFPNDIKPVETVFGGEGRPRIPKRRAGQGKEHLIELVDGQPNYFEVPTEIAKSFSIHDIGGLGRISALVNSATYKLFHPFFVTYNPGFVLANPFRDLRRTWINLGATDDISLGRLVTEWAKALPVAIRRQKGLDDAVIQEMMDSHALDIPYNSIDAEGVDSQVDALFKRHGLRESPKPKLQQIPVIGRMLELIEHAGAVTETATKVAGWRVLEEKGVPIQERAFRVRKYVGTPDYKQRGLATALTNSMMMYSRVRWNGLQADVSLATNPETAGGWWWRQLVNVVMPTSLAKLGAYGAFGMAIRTMFGVDEDDEESTAGRLATSADETGKRIAKYFLTDYDVMPLGVNEDGKAVFITIPRDDLGKFIARAWWHMTDIAQLGAGQDLRESAGLRDVSGSLFTDLTEEIIPSFSPPIDITNKWLQYGAGVNPIDSFYNQQIVPHKEWTAGGWQSDSKMIAWTLDKFGAPGVAVHYPLSPFLGESFETGTSGGTEAVMNTVGAATGLKRFLRVSDSGLTSEQWAQIENADQEATAFRLSLPQSAQDATTRRYFLMRREALGDTLNNTEQDEMEGLNLFYNAAYIPLRKQIQEAEEAGEDSTQFRADMERAANDPMVLARNAPTSIQENVTKYVSGVLESAVKPPPDPSNYRNRLKRFNEVSKEYKDTLQSRQSRFMKYGLSHDEAQTFMFESYINRYGRTTPSWETRSIAIQKMYGATEEEFLEWQERLLR